MFGGQPGGGPTNNETWILNWAASRPPTASITTPTAPTTPGSFGSPGLYAFNLSATDTQLSASASTHVTVLPPNGPPEINAGPDQTITFPASITLSGRASDDGVPVGSTVKVTWSLVNGPGAVTFSNSASLQTTASFSTPGIYQLRLTGTDSLLSQSLS